MIGMILGIVWGIALIAAAANGENLWPNLGIVLVVTAVGLLFPRTIGMAFTGLGFASLIAAVVALFNGGVVQLIAALATGVAAFAAAAIIAAVRTDAVDAYR